MHVCVRVVGGRERERTRKNFNDFAIAWTFFEFLLLTVFIENILGIDLIKDFAYC